MQVIFAAFGLAVGSSGVGELLEIEYAAERVKAAYIGTELMMLPFGQAGMGQGVEVAEGHIGSFRRRRGRHQLNVKNRNGIVPFRFLMRRTNYLRRPRRVISSR